MASLAGGAALCAAPIAAAQALVPGDARDMRNCTAPCRWELAQLSHTTGSLMRSSLPSARRVPDCKRGGRSRPLGLRAVLAERLPGLKEALQYRQLGDSDLVISEVTLGTMTWGNQNTEAEAHQQLSYAFDNGVNILDTAEMYPVPTKEEYWGATDRCIATWLKSMPRDKVVVASKVSGYSPALGYTREGGGPTRVDERNVRESVEKSLRRLGVDHIDLLQIHWPDRYLPLFGDDNYDYEKERDAVPFEEQLRVFQALISEGKIRHVGVSNESALGVVEFWKLAQSRGLPKIVSIQNAFSMLSRSQFGVSLIEACSPRNANVGLLAYSPLAGGSLTGKYVEGGTGGAAARKGRFNLFPGYMARFNRSLAKEAVAEYVQVARKHGLSPAQLALAFARSRPYVASTIIGATSMEQLAENLSAFTITLSEEALANIDAVYKRYRDPTMS